MIVQEPKSQVAERAAAGHERVVPFGTSLTGLPAPLLEEVSCFCDRCPTYVTKEQLHVDKECHLHHYYSHCCRHRNGDRVRGPSCAVHHAQEITSSKKLGESLEAPLAIFTMVPGCELFRARAYTDVDEVRHQRSLPRRE